MIVIHALWDCVADLIGPSAQAKPSAALPCLALWAENSDALLNAQPAAVATKRGRKSSLAPAHPFALNPNNLSQQLRQLTSDFIISQSNIHATQVRLPSVLGQPLPSPELPFHVENNEVALQTWLLPVVTLEPRWADDCLLDLPATPPQMAGDPLSASSDDYAEVQYGASLIYWMEVAKFAQQIIVGQRFAPGIRNGFARWEPVYHEEDVARLKLLARAMPPICRAFAPKAEAFDANLLKPDLILLNYVNTIIDVYVRGKLQSAKVKASKSSDVKDLFLAALTALTPSQARFSPTQDTSELIYWLTKLRATNMTAVRTCFRLESPEEAAMIDEMAAKAEAIERGEEAGEAEYDEHDDEEAPFIDAQNELPWRLSYHLQSTDDRSLLVPAQTVWQASSNTLTFLKRQLENPQEVLLEDLGRASLLFPSIDISLNSAQPTHLLLDTTQAYQFLRQSAALLEQSGFGVLLPNWWKKPVAKVGLKVKVQSAEQTSSGLMGLNAIVNYDWQVAIGDETLSLKEFEKLAKLKIPLIQVRGKWVELKPDEIEKALHFFKHHKNGQTTLGQALNMG
ncbi:MAG: SNF2 helicase-associated domain-containing protein, partial [Anaerolineae bacterium]|nr:SNF2 helicase-associated domain-containing protein [Anaerolineae bacterium]